jgi:hypothetical protein
MTRGELAFPVTVLTAVIALLVLGNFYYVYSWTTFAFPLGVGIAVGVLCAVEITAVLRGRRAAVAAGSDIDSTGDTREPFSLPAAAWMFGLVVFLYAFGFVYGAAVYLLVCLRVNGFSWLVSVIVALASMLVTWGLFIHILGVLLPVVPLWWP